jgi:uncharacterized protein
MPSTFSDAEIEQLQALLDAVPPPLQPLDVTALDGYLCGVLLQPEPVADASWLPGVTDVDARSLPPSFDATALHALVRRRHRELGEAIDRRRWFDPWVFALDDDAAARDSVLPWVAGFAAALERFPALTRLEDPALLEPLALLYLHFDADDLEDADELRALIDEIEPPPDLAEAVQDIVRAVMLMADVSRPASARTPPVPPAPPAPRAPRRKEKRR